LLNKYLTKKLQEKVEKGLDFFTEHGYNIIKEHSREYQRRHDPLFSGERVHTHLHGERKVQALSTVSKIKGGF
jgi:hypothetical protein